MEPASLTQAFQDALTDLRQAPEEAQDEGFPAPSQVSLSNAEHLLKKMFSIQPQRFHVYPMPEGEVAIDAANGRGSSVIVLCEGDGGALCSVNVRGAYRSKRYGAGEELADGFLRDGLREVEGAS